MAQSATAAPQAVGSPTEDLLPPRVDLGTVWGDGEADVSVRPLAAPVGSQAMPTTVLPSPMLKRHGRYGKHMRREDVPEEFLTKTVTGPRAVTLDGSILLSQSTTNSTSADLGTGHGGQPSQASLGASVSMASTVRGGVGGGGGGGVGALESGPGAMPVSAHPAGLTTLGGNPAPQFMRDALGQGKPDGVVSSASALVQSQLSLQPSVLAPSLSSVASQAADTSLDARDSVPPPTASASAFLPPHPVQAPFGTLEDTMVREGDCTVAITNAARVPLNSVASAEVGQGPAGFRQSELPIPRKSQEQDRQHREREVCRPCGVFVAVPFPVSLCVASPWGAVDVQGRLCSAWR